MPEKINIKTFPICGLSRERGKAESGKGGGISKREFTPEHRQKKGEQWDFPCQLGGSFWRGRALQKESSSLRENPMQEKEANDLWFS